MAINTKGAGNLFTKLLMYKLQEQENQRSQQSQNQFSAQQEAIRQQGYDKRSQAGIDAANARSLQEKNWGDEATQSDRTYEQTIAEQERERARIAKEAELERTGATAREMAEKEDKMVEDIARSRGIQFNPAELHTEAWLEQQVKAQEYGDKKAEKNPAIQPNEKTGQISEYGQILVNMAQQRLETQGPESVQKALDEGDLFKALDKIDDTREAYAIAREIQKAIYNWQPPQQTVVPREGGRGFVNKLLNPSGDPFRVGASNTNTGMGGSVQFDPSTIPPELLKRADPFFRER